MVTAMGMPHFSPVLREDVTVTTIVGRFRPALPQHRCGIKPSPNQNDVEDFMEEEYFQNCWRTKIKDP